MYARIEKTKENSSRAVASYVTQKKGDGRRGVEFSDNRPKPNINSGAKSQSITFSSLPLTLNGILESRNEVSTQMKLNSNYDSMCESSEELDTIQRKVDSDKLPSTKAFTTVREWCDYISIDQVNDRKQTLPEVVNELFELLSGFPGMSNALERLENEWVALREDVRAYEDKDIAAASMDIDKFIHSLNAAYLKLPPSYPNLSRGKTASDQNEYPTTIPQSAKSISAVKNVLDILHLKHMDKKSHRKGGVVINKGFMVGAAIGSDGKIYVAHSGSELPFFNHLVTNNTDYIPLHETVPKTQVNKLIGGNHENDQAGECAAPKLIWSLSGRDIQVKAMTEILFVPTGATEVTSVNVKDDMDLAQKYKGGEIVPSCHYCRALLPAMIPQLEILRAQVREVNASKEAVREAEEIRKIQGIFDVIGKEIERSFAKDIEVLRYRETRGKKITGAEKVQFDRGERALDYLKTMQERFGDALTYLARAVREKGGRVDEVNDEIFENVFKEELLEGEYEISSLIKVCKEMIISPSVVEVD